MLPRVVVFGIDGASRPVVDALLAEGRLPNLAALASAGSSGGLRSTFPAHTAPGWCSMFTGVNPGHHGVYQFWATQSSDYRPPVTTADDLRSEPLWVTLERFGLTSGVVNVPMTHPPRALAGGYMISWPLSRTIHYAQPKELLHELARAGVHYRSDLACMYRGEPDYADLAREYVFGRTDALLHLLDHRPVDVLFVVFSEVDRVSHHFWGTETAQAAPVTEIYEQVDEALGRLLERLPDETLVIVASDHGFGHCAGNLNVHELLADAGLLTTKIVPEVEQHASAGADDVYEDGPVGWFTSALRYRRIVDWDSTAVYMPTPGCFGLNLNLKGRQRRGTVAPAERASVSRDIADLFATLRAPGDAASPFTVVPREEVYSGPCVSLAPDLLLVPGRTDLMPHPGLAGRVWGPATQEAIHREEGIVFLRGPGVPSGQVIEAAIEDIAPTVLTACGLPVQDHVDASALVETHAPVQREPAAPVVKTTGAAKLSADEINTLEASLQALGYM